MHALLSERKRESESAFTLIELLVVMIIISILMAVAVPTFLAQKNNAQKSKATANIKQIVNAVESCAANNTDGTYAGCTTAATLKSFEKGLTSLTIADGTTPASNGYAITHVGASPTTAQGYIAQAQIKDGNVNVYFAEIHKEDGTLLKLCGAAPMTATSVKNTAAVPNSRTCAPGGNAAGTWG